MAGGMGFLGAALSGFGGGSVGGAVVHLMLDTKQFDAGLAKSQGKLATTSSSMVSRLKALGPAIGAVGAAAAIGIGIKAVQAFNESEAAIAQTNAVLKSTEGIAGVTAKEVVNLAARMQDLTTFSDEEVQSAENLLLTFTKISSDIFPRTTKAVLDTAQALGKDLNSTAIMVGKALNDPVKGLLSLTRAGVQFTEQQKTQIKTLVESGRVTEAQTLILGELNTQMGGSAQAAAKTFAGSFKVLANELNDVLEVLGKFIVNIAKALLPALKAVVPLLRLAADHAGLLLAAFAGFATVRWIIPFLASMTVKIQAVAGASLSAQVATSKWFTALAAAAGPIGLTVGAIVALGVLADKQPTLLDNQSRSLMNLGFSAEYAAGVIDKTYNEALKRSGGNARQANLEVVQMIGRQREAADQAQISAKHSLDYAASLGGLGNAARRAGRKVGDFAGMSEDALKSFKESASTSLNFVEASFTDLIGASNKSANGILRNMRRALRSQQDFAKNSSGFLAEVRDDFGPKMQNAAEQMVAILAQSGQQGADEMKVLRNASDTQIAGMLTTFLKGRTQADRTATRVTNIGDALNRLPSKKTIDIQLNVNTSGSGSTASDQNIADALAHELVRGQR